MGRTFRSKFSKREIIATALLNAEKHHKSLNKKKTARKPISENIEKVVETNSTEEVNKMDPENTPTEMVTSEDTLTS
mgnify:CR=1 FL=1